MKIICVGRNYLEHIKELNNNIPEQPVVFFKSASSIAKHTAIPHPKFSDDVHYELEVILLIDKSLPKGKKINSILDICSTWSVGIDFTARDLQNSLKSKGLPWELAKSFDNACILGKWKTIPEYNTYQSSFSLDLNGKVVQKANLTQMINNFEYLINYFTEYFSLEQGDIIFTGTPSGVGKISIGDRLKGELNGDVLLQCEILEE